ncbi:hypothetical protein [Campylobacter helveticus]|uniref:hypothetical protein n=1 Tax=Campylobacter helveticus TaxID=28898 RepID=UPI0009C298B9|nr:hypothetical protein [Campylobacter helveticus]ARE80252.1 hypothetical protein CHELV3228_0632 [Campylobacter helveticus]MCR2040499.1 hypothetical protein [Campylobacter helveticus]SMC24762.1 hypothetical protein SAMN02745125_01923 [Campylobacter helveticus]SUW82938.1 bacteriocin-type signal sequence domain-containing protein [Campylobacter helveticus]
MFQKLFSIVALSALLVSFSFANDLLAKLSKGAVSDNSVGVKVLSLDEMKEVRGGYAVATIRISQNELAALAVPDFENELGWEIKNGQINLEQTMKNDRGLCQMGSTQCYSNSATKKHLWQSQKRLQEFTNALDGSNPLYTALGFSVKRNVGFNRAGKFVYFSYGVVAVNRFDGSIRNVTNSATLNNNIIINELKRNYKDRLESALGGLR